MQRMTDEKMLAQREQVRQLARRRHPDALLHGTELNIDPDGEVDWAAEFLAGFDVCVASVHSHFSQSTEAHDPADRAGLREPVRQHHRPPDRPHDRPAAAASTPTGTRCSPPAPGPAPPWRSTAYPDRLDLRDEHILRAKRHGVRFADRHRRALDRRTWRHLRYGVGTAQRGWLTADDVINTWPLQRLRRSSARNGCAEATVHAARRSSAPSGRESHHDHRHVSLYCSKSDDSAQVLHVFQSVLHRKGYVSGDTDEMAHTSNHVCRRVHTETNSLIISTS